MYHHAARHWHNKVSMPMIAALATIANRNASPTRKKFTAAKFVQ